MEKGGRDRHEYDDRILLRQRMTPVVRRARVPLNRVIRYSGPGALSPRSWARGMSAGVCYRQQTRVLVCSGPHVVECSWTLSIRVTRKSLTFS